MNDSSARTTVLQRGTIGRRKKTHTPQREIKESNLARRRRPRCPGRMAGGVFLPSHLHYGTTFSHLVAVSAEYSTSSGSSTFDCVPGCRTMSLCGGGRERPWTPAGRP